MKKRILSIVLAICLVLSCVPITVFAADEVGDEYDFHELIKATKAGKTLKMDKDYSCGMAFRIGKDITIDLNGHVLYFAGQNNQIQIGYEDYKNKTVTIKDSDPNREHTGQFAGMPAGGVISGPNGAGSTFYINEGSTVNMEGGTIYKNKSSHYDGGAVRTYGTFNMTGGTIDGCTTSSDGGAVAVLGKGSFTMSGGTIKNCSAEYGGGVYVRGDGTFTMSGGTIENCTATERGGGVYNQDAGGFTMNGGTIDGCSAKIFGGGVYILETGSFTMDSGTIKNCSADYGGGVFAHESAFTMNGGTIEKCVATTSEGSYGFGGGVNLYYSNFTMNGGTIKDCTATDGESGALCLFANSTMTADGGSIHGSTVIDSLDGSISRIQSTSSDKYTKFYGKVVNEGVISGGVYYGGIQNKYDGTVTGTCYTVSFNSNGGSSVPPQRFVNVSTATAFRPTNPTRSDYVFKGWYNGSTKYTFTQPVTKSITLTAEWINTNVYTETDMKQVIGAGVPSIKLADDITLSSTLDLSDKDFTLDLNGHVLKGNIKLSDSIQPVNPSKLTLIDSNPTATHTDSNLPLGGVLDGEIKIDKKTFASAGILCANGGTVMGKVMLDDSSTQILCTSNTPTAFMDGVEGSGEIHGGMYYGGVKESCIEEKIVTFLSDGNRYAVGVVEFGQKAVAPVDPVKNGYVFAGWYIGNTQYAFIQPVMLDVVLNAKWVIENVSSEDKLREAIDLGSTFIRLQSDIRLSSALDLSLKDITIDLNGYVISGADISINTGNGKASLTLTDSRPNATHVDSTLPLGGVVTSKISMKQSGGGYNNCVLYANGGTVTSEFNTNTNAVAIKCTSNTPTVFTGKISGYTHLYGGIYYGAITSNVIIEAKKITFKNGDNTYAYEIVDSGNNTVAPISPSVKAGYQAFDGWYNGNTKYTFGSSLSEDIILMAKYNNPITYNISYNLSGGTATNPTSYTVESDAITLNNPTKTGYTFTGWRGTGLSSNTMTVTIPKGSTGDRTYTANFSQNSYTVTFNTDGGNAISDKTGVKWTDKVLDSITNPTKDGWEFIGWKCGDVTVTANTAYSDLAVNDTVTSITLVAQWKDITAPTGEISIGANKWNSFLNTITFGLFFKDTQKVTITASDNSGDAVTIEYLLSNEALADDVLANATFTAYTKAFSINPDNKYVIYAKLTDASGNVTYINSDGIVLDSVVPVISGVENGKTYCEAQTVTVTEEYIKSVTINGTKVSLDENNQFTLPAKGAQKIVATDKAGNVSAEITVTVNDGHTDKNNDHKCDYCGENVGVHEDKSNDHKCDYCGEEMSTCKDDDKDHKCDICGATLSEHSGGEATCKGKAICEYCGNEYGEVAPNSHADLKHFPANAATKTAEGNIEYWYCSDCGKYYKDTAATKEITKADTVIARLPNDSNSPQTVDNSHISLWFALLFVSGGLLTVTVVYGKKKKRCAR